MHSVENLEVLYRARRYWHTPQLDQAIAKIIKHFGDRRDIPQEFMTEFMREIGRNIPSGEGWNTFYETCPVVKVTPMTIAVVSQDLPIDILQRFPDFKSGGNFNVSKVKLQQYGYALHTRYGEYFYIHSPNGAIALPENKKLLEV
jgi:hypothetical protein